MKREILHGQGIQGMRLTLSVSDMFVASQVADELREVIANHVMCDDYNKCPYDQRKERYPEGQPKRIELSEMTLTNLHIFMNKLSFESRSTLFDACDQEDSCDSE